MIAGFAVGLILVASLAGVIGSFLVDERRERAALGDSAADPPSGGQP
jgi:hypothetical protein